MDTYRSTFKNSHTLLAVIHATNYMQVARNARIAYEEGVDGIFLINHHIDCAQLLNFYEQLAGDMPDFWIGVNCLDLGSKAIHHISKTCGGLWIDDAGYDEIATIPTKSAHDFSIQRKMSGWQGVYFGGVAFKYQKSVADVARAAECMVPFVVVITTSGEGTGHAPAVEKIRIMKDAVGDHPLAIASGVTPENVSNFLPYADCFLVATGISDSHTELNSNKVRQMVSAVGK